jgi:integrase
MLLKVLDQSPIENLVIFCLATGLRIGEATGLTWKNVDLSKAGKEFFIVRNQLQRVNSKLVLRPLKTEKSRRSLPLMGDSLKVIEFEQARQMVDHQDNPLGLVFLNPYGRPFDPKYVNKIFREALESAGLPPMGIHSLRHSAATFMLMSGQNLHNVSRYLGHSQIALTSNLYGHVSSETMRDSASDIQKMYRD